MVAVAKLRLAHGVVEVLSAFLICAAAAYTPEDNYLLSCGSSVDTPVGQRHFLADGTNPGVVTLTSPESAAVKAYPGSVPPTVRDAALYQTARVFSAPSSYAFAIRRPGRHFLRLHFFPFANGGGYDLAAAAREFKVSTQDAVLIEHGLPAPDASSSPVVVEFLLDVERDTLVVTFVPQAADGGVAFVNAVEVVSVPDDLVTGAATPTDRRDLNPAALPLQTAHRVKVGGPAVAPDDDALWREWNTDLGSLLRSPTDAVTRVVSYNGTLNRVPGQATVTDAPDAVYAMARELVLSNGSIFDAMKQMVWQFDVDAFSAYLIRFNFCDIVGKATQQLRIKAYVGSSTVEQDLDFAVPYYMDVVLPATDSSGILAVSVGPWLNKIVMPAAILNGIEIMKMHQSAGSVVVVEPAARARKLRLTVLVGSACGAFAFLSIAVALAVVTRKKKKGTKEEQPKPTQPQSSM